MGAMARIVRKNFPKHKIVFLSPCSAKKFEASKLLNKKGKPLVECCVTFTEMKQLIAKEKPKINNRDLQKNGSGFDFFGNDFTKIYPLAGGLCGTLHYSDLLSKSEVVSCDGAKNFSDLFRNHSDKVFFDVLFCVHGCINGPGVASNSPAFLRKQKVFSYINHAKKEKIKGKQGLKKYSEGIYFGRKI
jgi:iron only hydrogenase large subunit-like protein